MKIIFSIITRIRLVLFRHPIYKKITPINNEIVRLGTDYGGWSFVNLPSLKNATIIAAGMGEDISFEIDFAASFNAKVILIDPTPRAITHYDLVIERIGKEKEVQYSLGGAQDPASYDLKSVTKTNLVMLPVALAENDGEAEFFMPINQNNVSHSLNADMHGINKKDSITVKKMTIKSICNLVKLDLKDIEILKLDIEGAEVEVIEYLINSNIFPTQILVEFDELNYPTKKGNNNVTKAHELLINNGYILCASDGKADFLYLFQK